MKNPKNISSGSPTVLIVDDNEGDQFLCEHTIQKYNNKIHIIKAFDGKEALDILAVMEATPDLIFLDINMPGMNGFEFLERYHRLHNAASNIILMLTVSIDGNESEKGITHPHVKKVIAKPLSDLVVAECFDTLK